MTVKSPRFDFVYNKACEFLLSMGISSVPVNPVSLISRSHWGLITYNELCSAVPGGDSVDDIAAACRSRDGFTVFSGRNYCIAYNDTVRVKSRVAFTLMHEVGHIVCGHFSGRATWLCAGLGGDEYRVFEAEANYFAGNVLAPAAVVTACSLQKPELLKAACGLSRLAANARLSELAGWEPRPIDDEILRAFSTYIEICARRSHSNNVEVAFDEAIMP